MMLPKEAAMRTPRPLVLLLTTLALALPGLVAPGVASAAPHCGITWGSQPKAGNGSEPAAGTQLTNVRAGRHTCYDRLVLDIRGTTSSDSWQVEYVPQVRSDPSDRPVPLRGGAFLRISVGASDHTAGGTATYLPSNPRELVDVGDFRTFRQVAWGGSFEGSSTLGLGVRARLPFRVLALSGIPGSSGGTRVVVDVAHRWGQ